MQGKARTSAPTRSAHTLSACAAALLCALGLTGCVTFSGPPSQVAGTPSALPGDAPQIIAPLTPAERDHEQLVASYGGAYRSPDLERYLDDFVQRLAAQSDRPDIPYRLTILNSSSVNAFALPSGHIYVTRGLLALANDDAEIAAVIAHEMAHVAARHALARADLERQSELVTSVMRDVLRDQSRSESVAAKSQKTLAGFSRKQEIDADQVGVRTIAKAGFDPYGAARFLVSMNRQVERRAAASGGSSSAAAYDFQNTHPSTPERVALATEAAKRLDPAGSGRRDRAQYLHMIDGLTYGDDPAQGFLKGRAFFHPRLGFTFAVPDGFDIENMPQAILGSDGGRRALRLDSVSPKPDQSLQDYLTSGWIAGVRADSIASLQINGNEAVTATATGEDWTFRLYVIQFGGNVYRLIFAARELTPAIDRQFKEAAQTFRSITGAEMSAVRPFKIDVVTVRSGDTLASLAEQMAGDTRKLARFLVLNGFDRTTAIQPGERVKIVR